MSLREGSRVAYIGYGEDTLRMGDQGRLLSHAGSASHVKWTTGSSANTITLVAAEDLTPAVPAPTDHDEDIFASSLTFDARDTYDDLGEIGIINALSQGGHLTAFTQIAEDILDLAQAKISQEPAIAEALGHLDPTEQSLVLDALAQALFRDAFEKE